MIFSIIAIILLIFGYIIGHYNKLQFLERVKHGTVFVSIFFAVLGAIPFFIGPSYTPPSIIIQLLLIVSAIVLFLISFFWPDLTGRVVKKKLGNPCRITNQNTQLYLFRRDLPLEALVDIAKKEIVFVSVTHELIDEPEWEIIKHAIFKRDIIVRIYVLSPDADLSYQEKLFRVQLKDRIINSLNNIRKIKNSLKDKQGNLSVFSYTTPNFPFSLMIIDHVVNENGEIDRNACIKIEEHPASSVADRRPNEFIFRSDYYGRYDYYYENYRNEILPFSSRLF